MRVWAVGWVGGGGGEGTLGPGTGETQTGNVGKFRGFKVSQVPSIAARTRCPTPLHRHAWLLRQPLKHRKVFTPPWLAQEGPGGRVQGLGVQCDSGVVFRVSGFRGFDLRA